MSVAIVTGASQGIGRSTAIRLARDFSAIVLAARDRTNLEKTHATVSPRKSPSSWHSSYRRALDG
ncbi:SDR family NAD(P)-dependent oxidoreductase [Pendulispora brunnea]|uniref:SDR family NAD(P)-dependent oxidoreductase n=1 Tax=Pendulispora brunnea TaxID=2905690 RepID=A0ABZ2KFV3_9BACT